MEIQNASYGHFKPVECHLGRHAYYKAIYKQYDVSLSQFCSFLRHTYKLTVLFACLKYRSVHIKRRSRGSGIDNACLRKRTRNPKRGIKVTKVKFFSDTALQTQTAPTVQTKPYYRKDKQGTRIRASRRHRKVIRQITGPCLSFTL